MRVKRMLVKLRRRNARFESFWNKNIYVAVALIVAAAAAAVWATWNPQSPGVSIGLLALAAGIMSVRPKMRFLEKFAWVAILITFTHQEVKAIKQNDIDIKNTRDTQNAAFGAIVDNLKTAIQNSKDQYGKTVKHVDDVADDVDGVAKDVDGVARTAQQVGLTSNNNLKTSNEIFNATTGGDSFPVVDVVRYPGPEEDFIVSTHGKYALHDVHLQIVDMDAMNNGLRTLSKIPTPSEAYNLGRRDFPLGDLISKQTRVFLYAQTAFPAKAHYQIFGSALNGGWLEQLRVVRLDSGEIVSAIRVFPNGMGVGNPIFENVDAHYPREADGSLNWN